MITMLILHSKALKAGLSNAMLALMLGNLSETHWTNFKWIMSIRLKTGVKNAKTKAYMYFSVFILDLEGIRLCFHATSIYSQFFFLICPSHSTPTQSDI